MDPGWDHTENEDKLLLAHTLGMCKVTNDDLNINSVGGISCNHNMGSGDGLIRLNTEYGKHLSTIVLNTVNHIYLFLFDNLLYTFYDDILFKNFDHSYNYIQNFYYIIIEISYFFNSESTSRCNCTCDNKSLSNSKFICICISNCSGDKPGNCVCLCICKKYDNCKCICICICDKDGLTCPCACGTVHSCEKCLVKVDIQSLKNQTLQIGKCLYSIRCWISRLENQSCSTTNSTCCCCSCCPSGCIPESCEPYCCCKEGEVNYSSIMSRIHSIEFLFKELSNKMTQLIKFKNILLTILIIAAKCPKCPQQCCNDKIENLIKYTKNALRYYYLFGSRIKDIRSFVEYKINYYRSKEIISSLEKSVKPLSQQLYMINNKMFDSTRNNNSVVQANNLLMCVYSHYSLLSSLFFLIRVIKWAEFINDFLNTNDIADRCSCVKSFEWNKIDKFYIKGHSNYTHKIDTSVLSKLYKQTHGNHICLCLVFKYVFYPSIMSLLYYVFGTTLEIHGTFNRKFDNYNYLIGFNNDVSKMLLFIFHIISVIINIILKDSYVKWNSPVPSAIEVKCFCMNDKYYKNYMLNIILYVSSLMENIWRLDRQTFQVFVKNLSSFMWEFDAITKNNKNRNVELNGILMSLDKGETYFSSLSVTDSGLGLIIGGLNKKSLLFFKETFLQLVESTRGDLYWILIGGPKFNLFYDKFTWLSFNMINDSTLGVATKDKKLIGKISRRMSHKYLSIQLTIKSGCKKDKCECLKNVIYKIVYYVICVARGKFKTLSSQITNTAIIKFIQQKKELKLYKIINDMNKRTIDVTQVIVRMTKNKILDNNVRGSYGNISVTNVETRNWGYDTKYEHDVSTDKGFTYNYPDISNKRDSYASSGSSRVFKMILSRMLVGGLIVLVFLYLRVSYSINNPFCILYILN